MPPDPDSSAEAATPDTVEAREVWRELTRQAGKIDTTATLTGETHNRLVSMEVDVKDIKASGQKTADAQAQLVAFAENADQRAQRSETREIKADEVKAAREATEVQAATDAEAALVQAKADAAGARFQIVTKLVDWWTENWKMIAIAVAVLLGMNVSPLLQAFGLMSPTAVVVTPAATAAPAPAAPADPKPTGPAGELLPAAAPAPAEVSP